MVKELVTTETQGEETAGLMTHQQGTCTSKVSGPFQDGVTTAKSREGDGRHTAKKSASSVRKLYVVAARCPRTPLSLSHAWADTDHVTVTPRRRAAGRSRAAERTAAAVLPVIPDYR